MENDRIIPEGFEKAFLKRYEGWDEVDSLVYQFYNCELVDSLREFQNENTTVCVDLDDCVVQIYDDESLIVEIPFSLNMNLPEDK